jgi:hypothetical protein
MLLHARVTIPPMFSREKQRRVCVNQEAPAVHLYLVARLPPLPLAPLFFNSTLGRCVLFVPETSRPRLKPLKGAH